MADPYNFKWLLDKYHLVLGVRFGLDEGREIKHFNECPYNDGDKGVCVIGNHGAFQGSGNANGYKSFG